MSSPPPDLQPPAEGLDVVHVDAHLVVLVKPAGLLSVPGRGADKQDCLSARAQRVWSNARVVHRLDMATSGLMVMARGIEAQRELSRAFSGREIHKRYVALARGHMPPPTDTAWGTINLPILVDWPRRPLRIIAPQGQPSLTRWRVLRHEQLATGQTCTRLLLEPVTGRTHQLRVHLQALGHPILGDALYDSASTASAPTRLALHACELALPHPHTRQPLRFESPAPF